MSSSMAPMSRKGKWTTEEEALTARIIHYFSLGVLQLPEGTTLRAYLAQKLDCDPMRITKKFTGTNCLGKRVYHSCERTTATYEVAKQAVEELAELEARFRNRLERNKEKRTGIMDIEARLLGNRSLGINGVVDTKRMVVNAPSVNANLHAFGQVAAAVPTSMPPNANNVAAAAVAAAAAAAWNPLSQGYALPPGYAAVAAAQGLFGRSAVSGMPVTSAVHGFGLPPVARASPPSPGSSGHPHQLTATVLHSHQLHLEQFPHAPTAGIQQAPPCPVSKAKMVEAASRVGQPSAMNMLASQAAAAAAAPSNSGVVASDGESSSAIPSTRQQLKPASSVAFPPQQQSATVPAPASPTGSRSQRAYLATTSGQIHNPYWAYRQHQTGQDRGEYPDFAAAGTGPHGYPASTAQPGFPHLGMPTTLQQHQQWMHQQRHHGGATVPSNFGGSPWQYQYQHHQQQQQLPLHQHVIPPSLKVSHLSATGADDAAEVSKESAGTTPCSGSGSSSNSTTLTTAPHASGLSSTCSETSCTDPTPAPTSMPTHGATSADAAAVGSAEGDTVSATMASPRELQQMYSKGSNRSKSGCRRHRSHHHRGSINGEASSTISAPRSNTTQSSGSTTADVASSLDSLSGGSSIGGSRTGSGSGSDERQSKGSSSCGSGKGDGGEAGAGVSSISSCSGSDSGNGSEENDKEASPDARDDSQNCRSTSQRMDVDGAGGLLMGFYECLNKKHMLDQQKQQQQQQSDNGARHDNERPQHQGKHPSPQYRPKPPSPHAFPRVRHKHAARLEMEARLASCSGNGNSSSIGGEGASPPSAKKTRIAADLNKSSEQVNTNNKVNAGGSSGITNRSLIGSNVGSKGENSVREAVPPPRRPIGMCLHGRPESRKRPREQQQEQRHQAGVRLMGMVAPATSSFSYVVIGNNRRREGDVDTSEGGGNSTGDGSVSSEGGNSEEGGYEEDQDGGSWGSSRKDSGSFEGNNNNASVSEGDYGASDERSSSFDERDQNDNDEYPEDSTTTTTTVVERKSGGTREAQQQCGRSLLTGACHS